MFSIIINIYLIELQLTCINLTDKIEMEKNVGKSMHLKQVIYLQKAIKLTKQIV